MGVHSRSYSAYTTVYFVFQSMASQTSACSKTSRAWFLNFEIPQNSLIFRNFHRRSPDIDVWRKHNSFQPLIVLVLVEKCRKISFGVFQFSEFPILWVEMRANSNLEIHAPFWAWRENKRTKTKQFSLRWYVLEVHKFLTFSGEVEILPLSRVISRLKLRFRKC